MDRDARTIQSILSTTVTPFAAGCRSALSSRIMGRSAGIHADIDVGRLKQRRCLEQTRSESVFSVLSNRLS